MNLKNEAEPIQNQGWWIYFWIVVYSLATATMSYTAYIGVKIMPVMFLHN